MNWSRAWRDGWKVFVEAVWWGWLTPFVWLVALVILTVVAATGGFVIAFVITELEIHDLIEYDDEDFAGVHEGQAHLSDWLGWTVIGYIALVILLLLSTFGAALGDEWSSWSREKRGLRRKRIAEDERRDREHAERLERMADEAERKEDAASS